MNDDDSHLLAVVGAGLIAGGHKLMTAELGELGAPHVVEQLSSRWPYGAIYRTSQDRTAALDGWLHHYNHHRKHSALGHQAPIARLNERTNLTGTYS